MSQLLTTLATPKSTHSDIVFLGSKNAIFGSILQKPRFATLGVYFRPLSILFSSFFEHINGPLSVLILESRMPMSED